jgi:amino acid transporter
MSQRENLPQSDQTLGAGDPETKSTSLKKGTLGLFGIIFFVVAAAAPVAGMTGAFPVAIGIGDGAGAAGMFVAVGIVLLLFSVGYATMSHYVTNTGAFFAYVGRGLGIVPGVGSAFVSTLAYLTIQWGVLGFLAGQLDIYMQTKFSFDIDWWIYAIILIVIVWVLSAMSVDIGAKVLGVLLIIEIIALLVLAFSILFQGGADGIDLGASFNPSNIFAGGLTGGAGIAFAFALASFIGFEATAIYGEESKDPKRTVPRATYISVVFITVLFGLVGLALISGLGAEGVVDKVFAVTAIDDVPLSDPSAVLFSLSTSFVGSWLTELFSVIVLTSLFAAMLAFQNSAARYLFSMGRAGVLPKKLDKVNGRQSPMVATTVVSIFAILLVIAGIIFAWDPILNIFYWFGAVAVIAIVLTEILVSLSVIVYFRRTKEDTRAWHTLIAPILAIIGLVIGEYMLMSRFNLFSGTASGEGGPWEMNTTGWILVLLTFVVFIVGLIVGAARKNKENYDAVRNFVS